MLPADPIIRAATDGNVAHVARLLDSNACVNARDSNSFTCLHHAAIRANHSLMALLVDRQADLEAVDNRHRTPLLAAGQCGDVATVRLLLQLGANIEASCGDDTPLTDAVGDGNVALFETLIEKRADVHVRNRYHETLLHRVCTRHADAPKIAARLLEIGLHVDAATCNNETPLFYAIRGGRDAIVRVLLHAKANANAVPSNGVPLLVTCIAPWASSASVESIVVALLDAKANVNARTPTCNTALHQAAGFGLDSIMMLLIDCGADITIANVCMHQCAS
jgi:ankyrin repeat protein